MRAKHKASTCVPRGYICKHISLKNDVRRVNANFLKRFGKYRYRFLVGGRILLMIGKTQQSSHRRGENAYQSSDPTWRKQEADISVANFKSVYHSENEKQNGHHDLGNRQKHQAAFLATFHGKSERCFGPPDKSENDCF